jgi:hypothetical protein
VYVQPIFINSNCSISSSFYLTLNENSSQMLLHDVKDSMKYKYLLRIPTCPRHMYINIEDIHFSGKKMCGKFCSLLVAVRCVSDYELIKNAKVILNT